MSRSTDTIVKDLEAQLTVQRTATRVYQTALAAAFSNLRMTGREDVVKSIQRDSLKDVREELTAEAKAVAPAPQPVQETVDDEPLW